MRISRAASRSSCPSNHASLAAFTSPRCCSAACADFFKCDAPPVEGAPERPDTGADAARLQLLPKLDERDIRRLGDLAKEESRDEARIVIDESLDPEENPAKEGRYRFTLAHEGGGHWRLHRHLFAKDPTQAALFGGSAG